MITAKAFYALLKEHGWTGPAVSKKLGHGASWLSKKLHGAREMKCEELVKICLLTGIPPHALLGWDDAGATDRGSRMIAEGSKD